MTTDTRISQKDLYGFPVSLTSDEVSDRIRCFKKSKKRQARDWAFETAHRHIPTSVSHEDMKRRCRKVRVFCMCHECFRLQKKCQPAYAYTGHPE